MFPEIVAESMIAPVYDPDHTHVHVIVMVHIDQVKKFSHENVSMFPEMIGAIEAVE
jgi:hypothetical protein